MTAAPHCRRFQSDERGTIAILFALMAVPMLGMISAGIDYGMALRTHGSLQRAADAAAAAALGDLPAGRDAVAKTLRLHFDANVPDRYKGLDLPFTTSNDPPKVTVKAETVINTTMLSMMGYKSMPVRVEGVAILEVRTKQFDVPAGFENATRELAGQGINLPKVDAREADQAIKDLSRDLGIDISSLKHQGPSQRELEEMAEAARRELDRVNLGDLLRR